MKYSPHIFSALLFASLPAQAATGDITVAAGEHGQFSRIVLTGGNDGLLAETAGRTIRLYNVGDSSDVDLADINDRGKAFRVEHASANRDFLTFTMNCDCAVRTYQLSDEKFVIDITEAKSPTTLEPSPPVKKTATAPVKKEQPKPTPKVAKTAANVLDDTLSVQQAHDRMMALLHQAANEGLIKVREGAELSPPTPLKEPSQPDADTKNKETDQLDRMVSDEKSAEPAQATSVSLASHIQVRKPGSPASHLSCISNEALEIDGEAVKDEPLIALEELSSAISDTSAAKRKAAVSKYAEALIAIGFGEEAFAALEAEDATSTPLYEIAKAVAERPIDPEGFLLRADQCTGAHALWQAVVLDDEGAAIAYDRSGKAIHKLPYRLRDLIATRLAVKMVDLKAWDEAKELFDVASKDKESLSPELVYVETRLNDPKARDENSRVALRELATEQTEAAEEALLALADSYADAGETPHPGFEQEIGALAKVTGSTRAAFSEAFSWAAIGNLDAAMTLLRNEAKKSDEIADAAGAVGSAVISRALEQNDAITTISAINVYLDNEAWLDPKKLRPARTKIAKVALSSGLPNLAVHLLSTTSTPMDDATAIYTARAALAAGEPATAIRLAAARANDPNFGAIIAKANIQKDEYDAALAAASAISNPSLRAPVKARAGWLARDWRSASEAYRTQDPSTLTGNDALNLALSAYMAGETDMPAASDAILSDQSPALNDGVRNFFLDEPRGTKLQRALSLSTRMSAEIAAYEEVLSDG